MVFVLQLIFGECIPSINASSVFSLRLSNARFIANKLALRILISSISWLVASPILISTAYFFILFAIFSLLILDIVFESLIPSGI